MQVVCVFPEQLIPICKRFTLQSLSMFFFLSFFPFCVCLVFVCEDVLRISRIQKHPSLPPPPEREREKGRRILDSVPILPRSSSTRNTNQNHRHTHHHKHGQSLHSRCKRHSAQNRCRHCKHKRNKCGDPCQCVELSGTHGDPMEHHQNTQAPDHNSQNCSPRNAIFLIGFDIPEWITIVARVAAFQTLEISIGAVVA